MSSVGTTAWAEATGARLRPRDLAELTAQAVELQTRLAGRTLARLVRAGRPPTAAELGMFAPPETEAVHVAAELCARESPEYLLEHCHRSYLWGRVLGERDRLAVDDELLFVASMLHDLGLTAANADPVGTRTCFTAPAARAANRFGPELGWSAERTAELAEAITLHLNPRVRLRHGSTAYLLAAGTALDVVGVRALQVDPGTRAAVIAAHPRLDLKEQVLRDLREYGDAPRSRTRFLFRAGQFAYRVRHAPFAE